VGLLVNGCSKLTSSAEEEVSSPFRTYLLGAMAAVLAVVVRQGATGHACSRGVCLQTACIVQGLMEHVWAYQSTVAASSDALSSCDLSAAATIMA
jgi:hypothetical protein